MVVLLGEVSAAARTAIGEYLISNDSPFFHFLLISL